MGSSKRSIVAFMSLPSANDIKYTTYADDITITTTCSDISKLKLTIQPYLKDLYL